MHLPPLDVAVYPIMTTKQAPPGFQTPHSSPSTSSTSSSSPQPMSVQSNSAGSPDVAGIQKAIRNVFRSSKIQVQKVERIQGRLYQTFIAKLADGDTLVLKCPPSRSVRMLRQEQHGLENEQKTLETLRAYTQLPIPQVIKFDTKGGPMGSQFLLLSHVPGRRLSELSLFLSSSEKQAIDRTLGTYVRALSALSATQFGLTHRVFAKKGHSSWKDAFLSLLEALLRDAEDKLITLPYESIRYYTRRHLSHLDQITEPRLVALHVCDPQNVLLDERTRQVTGLVGFSDVIWGDPMMNDGIIGGRDAFFEGFGQRPAPTGGDLARQLIYTTYRSAAQIIAHYYRPHIQTDEKEARRSLNYALNELARA